MELKTEQFFKNNELDVKKISKEELLKYNSKVSSPYTSIYPPATATASNG